MGPRDLKIEQFRSYPPLARKVAEQNLDALRGLPLSFLPSLLRELIEYDFKFPAERKALDDELRNLSTLSREQSREWLEGFSAITLSPRLEQFDWINSPAQFVEQLSAHLWTTHQLDAFRMAANSYADRLRAALPPAAPPVPRLGISIVGQGVTSYEGPLFRKLRPHGAYFRRISPENGLRFLLDAVSARSKAHPVPYAHWYIDGGEAAEHNPELTSISYAALEPVRGALLRRMRAEIARPGMGPEMLRTLMAQLHPADLGIARSLDPLLDRFQIKLLTEGSGTQIFSTSFAQWAAREALRRAQPLTLMVRFAARQRQKPMNELLAEGREITEPDYTGSLVDADMGAYYNWLNQQRLPGAEKSLFVAWFEGHNAALAIGPAMPRGTESDTPTDLRQLLSWMA
ncbi:MAG: hypothetical protein JOZ14_00840 [Acidobacteria bacterium]|nr:hypothetical protein [Acidobacteriota bacterium]